MVKTSPKKAGPQAARAPSVWTSEHARINDLMIFLQAEDPGWDLDKQGVLEPFTAVVAKELGNGKYYGRYKDIFRR